MAVVSVAHDEVRECELESRARFRSIRSIELFTGAGGLALATHTAGFSHAALVEWAPNACETLRTNVRLKTIPGIGEWDILQADVRDIDFATFGPVELVAGGPP